MGTDTLLRLDVGLESAHEVWGEIQPLLEEHWREIAHFDDIPLRPRREVYLAMQDADVLRVFTVRDERRLVGYAVYIVGPNLHYSTSKQAQQDVLFLMPEYRNAGNGFALIDFADRSLRAEGVQAVYQHVKHSHDFGRLLQSMGYQSIETNYVRRLDHGGQ